MTPDSTAQQHLHAVVADFLFAEASLLDARRYEEWEALWADDGVYTIPASRTAIYDPLRVSLLHADRDGIRNRVERLVGGHAYSQDPPSDTTRMVGNIRVTDRSADAVVVESVLIVHEFRRDHEHVWSGRVQHRLECERMTDGSAWSPVRIASKVVALTNCERPLSNMTFLL